MRERAEDAGLVVQGYSGTTGILLAFDVATPGRKGLLGFALERREGKGKNEWLFGMLPFAGQEHRAGERIPTSQALIQKFRWSDYRVRPGRRYTYTVHPVYGKPGKLDVQKGVAVTLTTAGADKGAHRVLFNRAAAASQAFSLKFPEVEAQLKKAKDKSAFEMPAEALDWLGRGVPEQIVGFLAGAKDKGWALDVAIYEYELPLIVAAVDAAHKRGVDVRVIYHAKKGDEQTHENEESLKKIPKARKRARVTNKICHHKFIVRSRIKNGRKTPEAVLCGSTNFTHNGAYRQANVVHVTTEGEVARSYQTLFDKLWETAGEPSATRAYITEHNAIDPAAEVFAGFSPRTGGGDLQAFVELIEGAKRDVLFCTAFDLFDGIEHALLGEAHDPILRFGVQNKRSQITGFHADRTARFAATAMLNTGLEGWLKESTAGQRGNILIHTKLVVVDFTSDSPIVISGSHNLSNSASSGNDENFLIVKGNTDVADCYGCELMRIYDHYRFRHFLAEKKRSGKVGPPPSLTPDDSWTDRYFRKGTLSMLDRLRFAGR